MAIAVFDYTAWLTRYPEFDGAVSAELAALLFTEAGLIYLNNTDASPVADAARRLLLLNMVVAHLAAIGGALEAGGKPTGIVGRITEGTEGSVSVKAAAFAPGTSDWWGITSYGLAFWAATKRLRSARYVPAPPPMQEPFGAGLWRR